MQKMQRVFNTNICKLSQQNEEIISFNSRLSKVDSGALSLLVTSAIGWVYLLLWSDKFLIEPVCKPVV